MPLSFRFFVELWSFGCVGGVDGSRVWDCVVKGKVVGGLCVGMEMDR